MALDSLPGAARGGSAATLFSPTRIGSLELPNRLAVAPMTRVSATADGRATPRMIDHYGGFAEGGFALLITEGIYTDKAFSQGYLHQPGLTDDAQLNAWRPVVERVRAAGGRIIAQLMHAGALSQGNPHRRHTVGPSAVEPRGFQMALYRGSGPYRTPAAMTAGEIEQAVAGFAEAAARAEAAGFDGVEVHAANGYLLDQFLTEGLNLREDRYGGAIEARARLVTETVEAVRSATGSGFVVGVRVSQGKVNDASHRWSGAEADARAVFPNIARAGVDYVHTTERQAWKPAFGDAGPSLASLAKAHARVPVIANGSLHDPERAAALIDDGEADVVSLARGALGDGAWPNRVRRGERPIDFDGGILQPLADLANADAHRAARSG